MRLLVNLNNYTKFETLITSIYPQPDIISVTKTWLIEQSGSNCSLIGYTFIGNCKRCFCGGGVGFYVKNRIPIMFESLFIEINLNNQPILYGTI